MEKIPALLINYTGRKGGGPLDAYEMTKALIEQKIPTVAIISDQIENLSLWKELPLERLVIIPTYSNIVQLAVNSIFFRFRQRRKIRKETADYDIRVIYCPMGAFWSEKINAIFPNARKSIVIHDPIPHSGDKRKAKLIPDHTRNYDVIFVHSKKFVDYVANKYKKPTYYLSLGRHDIYKYLPNKKKIIDYDREKINFLFFGRISKYKGLDVLARAYELVYKKLGDQVTLTIIGSGDFSPYQEAYDKLENITIINRWIKDEETDDALSGENLICICPYIDATQSGIVLLAMDYHIPLIATKTGGMIEQVQDGETGILVPPSDEKSLSNAMIMLAQNKDIRNAMTKKQEEYMKELGWDVSARQLIDALDIENLRK